MTNADRIRTMTDEEIAEWLTWICDPFYAPKEGWLRYLKAEVTDEQ